MKGLPFTPTVPAKAVGLVRLTLTGVLWVPPVAVPVSVFPEAVPENARLDSPPLSTPVTLPPLCTISSTPPPSTSQ